MKLNKHYDEQRLGYFTDDINSHLALQMKPSRDPLKNCHHISVSESEVSFSAFEKDELNSIQQALILLIIAVSDYDEVLLVEH